MATVLTYLAGYVIVLIYMLHLKGNTSGEYSLSLSSLTVWYQVKKNTKELYQRLGLIVKFTWNIR